MASASAIRAGAAYIELYATDERMVAGLKGAQQKLKAFDASVSSIGRNLLKFGAILSTPFVAGTKTFGDLEQSLAGLKTRVSPDDFNKIKDSVSGIGERTGNGPEQIVEVLTDLAAKGYSTANGISQLTESILKFSKVSGIDAHAAIQQITDATISFKDSGVSANHVMALLSNTATAGRTSISNIADAFNVARSEFATGGQTADTLAQAIGILADAGIHGSEAGSTLAKFLETLQNPGAKAKAVIEGLGIATRTASGDALPLSQVIGELQTKINSLNPGAKADDLRKLLGGEGLAAGKILIDGGAKAFDNIATKMNAAIPFAQKYETIVDTLYGALNRLKAIANQVSDEIGKSIAGPVRALADAVLVIAKAVREWAANNQGLLLTIAAIAIAATAAGIAFLAFGVIISAVGSVAGGLVSIFAFIGSAAAPVIAIVGALSIGFVALSIVILGFQAAIIAYILKVTGGLDAFAKAFKNVKDIAVESFSGIANALKAGNLTLAAQILGETIKSVFFEAANAGANAFLSMFDYIKIAGKSLAVRIVEFALIMEIGWIKVTTAIQKSFAALKSYSNYEANAKQLAQTRAQADNFRNRAKNEKDPFKKEVYENAANRKDLEGSALQDKLDGNGAALDAESKKLQDNARASVSGVLAQLKSVRKDGIGSDPLGLGAAASNSKAKLQELLRQAGEEASKAGPGPTGAAAGDRTQRAVDQAAQIPDAVAQRKFESFQTFNGNIANRVGFGGDARADKQEKLLEKIGGGIDRLNTTVEQNGGID